MRLTRLSLIALCFLVVGAWALPATAQTTEDAGLDTAPPAELGLFDDCRPVTLMYGYFSGVGEDHPRFAGADLVIRELEAWHAFWEAHTQQLEDPPPLPPVDFRHRVVLVTLQGPRPTVGGPNVAITGLEPTGPFLRVRIFDDPRPGPEEGVTRAFHIVSVPRPCLPPGASLVFVHRHPIPDTGVLNGHVLAAPPDEEPHRLPGAHLVLVDPDGQLEPRHTVSGRDGSYFFVDVPPGEYILHAEARGFEPVTLPVAIPPNHLTFQPVGLTPLAPEPAGRMAR